MLARPDRLIAERSIGKEQEVGEHGHRGGGQRTGEGLRDHDPDLGRRGRRGSVPLRGRTPRLLSRNGHERWWRGIDRGRDLRGVN